MLEELLDAASSNKIRRATLAHDILEKKKSIQLLYLEKQYDIVMIELTL